MRRLTALVLVSALLSAGLVGCIPGDGKHTADRPAGFLWGIWHGWIAPVSLVIGIFNREIRVYEPNNRGWWYDFAFYMAVVGGFGGLSLVRRKRR